MDKTEAERLLTYNRWATARILTTAARLDPTHFVTAPANHPVSVRDILVHMLGAERVWRVRFETGASPKGLNTADFPTVEPLRTAFEDEQPAMLHYVATLDDAALHEAIQFRRTSGEVSAPYVRSDVLFQLIMHGIAHRAEVAAILTAYGQSPGDLDFLVFLAEGSR